MKFLSKESVGLDISDTTIEVAALTKNGSKIAIQSLARVQLESGVVKQGKIQDATKLGKTIQKVFAEAKPQAIDKKEIILSLPESQTYIYVASLKAHEKDQQESLVEKEAQKNIPLEKNDLLYSYEVLTEDSEKVEILMVAASRQMVSEWQKFFETIGIQIALFDEGMLANFRGLFLKKKEEPVCIIDLGNRVTSIGIFNTKGLQYSYQLEEGGGQYTQEIVKTLNISEKEAEDMKRNIGLSKAEGRVFPILVKALEPLVKELQSSIKYFEGKAGEKVKKIVLVGGSSQLKGITDYISTNLSIPAAIGTSAILAGQPQLQGKSDIYLYIKAIGSAIRGLDTTWKQDPALQPEELKQASQGKESKETSLPAVKEEGVELEDQDVSKRDILDSENTDDSSSYEEDLNAKQKLRKQKIILAVLLGIGILVVGGAFWFRGAEKAKQEEARQSEIVQFTQTQLFAVEVAIAVAKEEYAADRVSGRIIDGIVQGAGDASEAMIKSKIEAQRTVLEGEILWSPSIDNLEEGELVFPLTIRWIVFHEQEANDLLLREVEKLNTNQVDFVLNNIQKVELTQSENPNIFLLQGEVTIASNELIEVEADAFKKESEEEDNTEVREQESSQQDGIDEIFVTILDTPTGWLNVREGPSTNYAQIARVNPGENYLLLQESEEWYNIQINEETTGWVFSLYANKVTSNE